MKRICPNDPDATRKLKECEKAVQKIRFEEAISVGDTERRSIADSLDYHIIGIWSLNFHIFWHFTISRFDIYYLMWPQMGHKHSFLVLLVCSFMINLFACIHEFLYWF